MATFLVDMEVVNEEEHRQYSSAPMYIEESTRPSTLLNLLNAQRDTDRFCDVIIHVDDYELNAHRNVLAACSPYFDSIFRSNVILKEHVTIENSSGIKYLHGSFKILLDYLYTGLIAIDETTVSDLLILSNRYLIIELKNCCCEFLQKNFQTYNCLFVKELASICNCCELLECVDNYIHANINSVIEGDEILSMSSGSLEAFLSTTGRSLCLNDDRKYWLILRWVKHASQQRQGKIGMLLKGVNFQSTNMEYIYTSIKYDELFLDKKCFAHVLQSLADQNALNQEFVAILANLKTSPIFGDKSLEGTNIDSSESFIDMEDRSLQSRPNELSAFRDMHEQTGPLQEAGNSDLVIDTYVAEESGVTQPYQSCYMGSDKEIESNSLHIVLEPNRIKNAKAAKTRKTSLATKKRSKPVKTKQKHKKQSVITQLCNVENESISSDICTTKEGVSEFEQTSLLKPILGKRKRGRPTKDGFKCDKCRFTAESASLLSEHTESAHRGEEGSYTCNICNFECQWNKEYMKHMKSHFPGPPYHCTEQEGCTFKADRFKQLLLHRSSHSEDRPHSCTVCNATFKCKGSLAHHLRLHTGEKKFECEECGRRFATKGTLQQHSVTHSDVRPYLCDMCGFSTKFQSHLKAHKRIHTGALFKCSACEYTCPKQSSLTAHLRIHTKQRNHKCPHCQQAFLEKSHLTRHIRTHQSERPYKCSHCDYASIRSDKLRQHVKKHHDEDIKVKTPYPYKKGRDSSVKPYGDVTSSSKTSKISKSNDDAKLNEHNNEQLFYDDGRVTLTGDGKGNTKLHFKEQISNTFSSHVPSTFSMTPLHTSHSTYTPILDVPLPHWHSGPPSAGALCAIDRDNIERSSLDPKQGESDRLRSFVIAPTHADNVHGDLDGSYYVPTPTSLIQHRASIESVHSTLTDDLQDIGETSSDLGPLFMKLD